MSNCKFLASVLILEVPSVRNNNEIFSSIALYHLLTSRNQIQLNRPVEEVGDCPIFANSETAAVLYS